MRITVAVVLILVLSTSASAQLPGATTQTGSVSKGVNKVYAFTTSTYGQVTATLSWDAQNAHLLMVLVCGSSEPITYGAAVGLLDRFARFESGVMGGEPCGLAVTSADETANFRLHVVRSGDQTLEPRSVTGSVQFQEAREGTFVSDEALRVLNRLRQRVLR